MRRLSIFPGVRLPHARGLATLIAESDKPTEETVGRFLVLKPPQGFPSCGALSSAARTATC